MYQFRFFPWCWRHKSPSSGKTTRRRRLTVESLEPRALLSATTGTPSSVASLPPSAQQIIAGVIGQQAQLSSPDTSPDDYGFGESVSISGNTLVVGAPEATVGDNAKQGAAYVFVESASGWANMIQVAELTASDGAAGDNFGWSVSISANTVVVGAWQATVGGNSDQGAAYVFAEPGSGWADMTQTAKLTASAGAAQHFGYSVSISGNTIVAGAFPPADSDSSQAAACVFVEPGSGWTNMTQSATLSVSEETASGLQGYSVSISGDTVVVGAADTTVGGNANQGAAFVFAEPASGWADMTQTAELTASDGATNYSFGYSVSISGDTIVATGTGSAAYVFTEPASGWANMTQTAELTTSTGSNGFISVAISGSTVVGGSVNVPLAGASVFEGAAYVFSEPGSGWANMTQTAELTESDGTSSDFLGVSVAISGNTIVAGSDSRGGKEHRVSCVFSEPAAGWTDMTQTAELTAARTASDGPPYDDFGASVAISGNTLVLGSPDATVDNNTEQGAAYVFIESGSGSTEVAELTASDGAAFDHFGISVSISGDTIVVTTVPVNPTVDTGAAYVFATPSSTDITAAAVVTTTTATGTYLARTSIPITVTFDEPVTVTGTPQLALNAGRAPSGSAIANYTSGSGTSTLTFTYTVVNGQNAADLDYASTDALSLNGGTIINSTGSAANLTLPATGTDGLAAQDITIAVQDDFASGGFTALPWQLSTVGTAANWTVQSANVMPGPGAPGFAAQSGLIGAGSNSALSVTLTVGAGELSFWSSLSSATGAGSLIFEVDGTPEIQLSGTTAWQESYVYVSAGQHTFTWLYGKNAGDPGGNDFADLDDVQFVPGTTLTVAGSSSSEQFSFNASGADVVVGLNGLYQSFAPGEFTTYLFIGAGGTATLTGNASGNTATLNSGGSGQLYNATAGFTVAVTGMTDIDAAGSAGDTAIFNDTAGNSVYYAYAVYGSSGAPLAGMYAESPQGVPSGYSNTATGFGANIGNTTSGSSDVAVYFNSSLGSDTFYSYTDYQQSGEQLSGMYGSGYSNTAKGFDTNVAYAIGGGSSDTAAFFDSAGDATYYAYADYGPLPGPGAFELADGQQLAGMLGSGYANSAKGFGTNVGVSTAGASDVAAFFDSPDDDTFSAYAPDNQEIDGGSGPTFASMTGSFGGAPSPQGVAWTNTATGFATMEGFSTNGGSDTANLYNSPVNDILYTDAAIASLYGDDGSYAEKTLGFSTVNANGAAGGANVQVQGPTPVSYQLNLIGTWTQGTAPAGYTITADRAAVNASQATDAGFTFAGFTSTGDTYNYTITSTGGPGALGITGSATLDTVAPSG
jgi:hypothetical protein